MNLTNSWRASTATLAFSMHAICNPITCNVGLHTGAKIAGIWTFPLAKTVCSSKVGIRNKYPLHYHSAFTKLKISRLSYHCLAYNSIQIYRQLTPYTKLPSFFKTTHPIYKLIPWTTLPIFLKSIKH